MPWPSGIRSFRREWRLTRWRLKAMGELLDRWDEYEAMAALPPGTRKKTAEIPELSRDLVKELHAMLVDRLARHEEMWERRN